MPCCSTVPGVIALGGERFFQCARRLAFDRGVCGLRNVTTGAAEALSMLALFREHGVGWVNLTLTQAAWLQDRVRQEN
jgi:hypothetical protein